MKLEDILKQLKKEKDPIKYLKELIKKTADKNLKKELEKILEGLEKKSKPEAKPRSLEEALNSSFSPSARVPTEVLEDYQSRSRARVLAPLPFLDVEKKPGENYGGKIKGNYITTSSEFKTSLESKGLVSRTGFSFTTETQEAIRKESSNNPDYDERVNLENYSTRSMLMDQENMGRTFDLKETHKKKKELEVYHG